MIKTIINQKLSNFKYLENKEENIEEKFSESIDELVNLKSQIEEMELNVLKAEDELKWEDQQKIKELVENAKEELNKIKDISNAMETLLEESEKHNLFLAASNLYKIFRIIKKKGYKKIQINKIPNSGIGVAINDRINRASKF